MRRFSSFAIVFVWGIAVGHLLNGQATSRAPLDPGTVDFSAPVTVTQTYGNAQQHTYEPFAYSIDGKMAHLCNPPSDLSSRYQVTLSHGRVLVFATKVCPR